MRPSPRLAATLAALPLCATVLPLPATAAPTPAPAEQSHDGPTPSQLAAASATPTPQPSAEATTAPSARPTAASTATAAAPTPTSLGDAPASPPSAPAVTQADPSPTLGSVTPIPRADDIPAPTVGPAAAAPTITLAPVTCTGTCAASSPFMAGLGSFRITGRVAGVAAGTELRVEYRPNGVARGIVARPVVSSTGTFAATVPIMHAGSVVLGVSTPDGRARTETPALAVGAPAVVMARSTFSASTMSGTPVQGRLSHGLAGRSVRLAVWTWFPAEQRSRWSWARPVTTGANGSFSTVLNHDNGLVGTRSWRVESNYASNPAAQFGARFTERKIARIEFATSAVTASMVPVTYHSGCPVKPSQLTRLSMNHFGFDGRLHRGHLVVRSTEVARFRNVFAAAFTAHFPMRVMKDPSPYRTDDTSMAADNTYAFFCRQVNGNPYVTSPHSYGRAVDINPVENPYRKPNGVWYPVAGRPYVDRSNRRPGMLFSDSPMTKAFLANNFKWLSGFDWQHFQVR